MARAGFGAGVAAKVVIAQSSWTQMNDIYVSYLLVCHLGYLDWQFGCYPVTTWKNLSLQHGSGRFRGRCGRKNGDGS